MITSQQELTRDLIFYSVCVSDFEKLDFKNDALAGVRANYFNSNHRPQADDTDISLYDVSYKLSYKMSILKSADPQGSACNRFFYNYAAVAGLGHFIHTYNCDGNPIPTFTGEPERVAIPDDIDTFTDNIWCNLHPQNKISLYVRYIDLDTGAVKNRMINKNK